jgi:hypothetical protein
MTKHYIQLTPYFRSQEFQDSHEREIEKSIEDKVKSVICIITKIWRCSSNSIKENKDLSKRLEN